MVVKNSREIATELLKKWVDDEVSLMWEFSEDFDNTRNDIWQNTQIYLSELHIDDVNYIEELKDRIFH